MSQFLSDRWGLTKDSPYRLRPHKTQSAFFRSPHRFNINPSGRRSGKTELAKRKLVKAAIRGTRFDDPRFFAAAPTRDQAKGIYWRDLKLLTPKDLLLPFPRGISESDLTIRLITGAEITVVGMDKPERIEGRPWDGGILDEYGNMRGTAWEENVRPALSDRRGWVDFIGVPEGKHNHYYDLYLKHKEEFEREGDDSEWGIYEWESREILDPAEIAAAKKDLHPLVFEQEYGGKFVDFTGAAIFDTERWLENKKGVEYPTGCDAVVAVIDTAIKTGKGNDATGVIYYAVNIHAGRPLVIIDWDIRQIEGGSLVDWLPSVYETMNTLANRARARRGAMGAFIEDRGSGSILIQQAIKRKWLVQALPETLTAIGKDERALSTSGYHYSGKCKITQEAYDKTVMYKGAMRNHLVRQVQDFRIGDPDAAKRADDLLDCYTYGLAIVFGDYKGL